MAKVNGTPTGDPRTPGSDAYNAAARSADTAVELALRGQLSQGHDPGAVIAGAVNALVRICIAVIVPPVTVRSVTTTLFPSINHAAENLIKGQTRLPKL